MATPIGYPDWQKVSTRTGAPLVYQTNPGNAAWTSAVLAVGNYEVVELNVNPTGTDYYTATITWYEDSGGTRQVLAYTVEFGDQAGEMFAPLPVVAPFMRIAVTNGAPAGTGQYQIAVVPTLNTVTTGYPGALVLANTGATTQAASSSVTRVCTPLVSGKVAFDYWTSSPAWSVALEYLDGSGNWVQFYFHSYAAAGGDRAQVGIPMAPVRMRTTNNDTALHSFQAAVTTLP